MPNKAPIVKLHIGGGIKAIKRLYLKHLLVWKKAKRINVSQQHNEAYDSISFIILQYIKNIIDVDPIVQITFIN
jgi:hypothetical protein